MTSFAIFVSVLLLLYSGFIGSAQQEGKKSAVEFSKREEAYRNNNLGVALLEQYKPKDAVEAFNRALSIDSRLRLAQINLSIAYYYLPDADSAKVAAEKALAMDPQAPQPHFILGLIARTDNRFDDAIKEFQTVLTIDRDDVATNVNIGQIYVQQRKYREAIESFRRALVLEPYNETALYNLGISLTRTGAREEGQQVLQKFQQLRQRNAGTTIGTNYLESGQYAEAIVSTGTEPELVDRATPEVNFVDATSLNFVAAKQNSTTSTANNAAGRASNSYAKGATDLLARNFQGGPTLFDFDNDGDLDVLELDGNRLVLWRNDNGKFVDITSQSAALGDPSDSIPIAAAAGDYDNDGLPDLLVVRNGRIALYHNDGKGKFSDASKQAGLPDYPYLALSAAFVDMDHDGDLDVFIAGFAELSKTTVEPLLGKNGPFANRTAGSASVANQFVAGQAFDAIKGLPGAPNLLLRNNGDSTFSDVTEQAKVRGALGHAVAVVPTDYNNRRDVDLLVVNYGAAPQLFSNQRDGSFRDVTKEAGLDVAGAWTSVAAGDVNKDGFTDFFFGSSNGPGLFAISDGHARFKTETALKGTVSTTAAQFIDYDNDGLVDLVTLTGSHLRVWRNLGNEWSDVTRRASTSDLRVGRTFSSADLDNDGDVDLMLRGQDRRLRVLRNEGGNRNRSVKLDLHGRVSNKSAVEVKVELRAGSLYQKLETYAASPAPAPSDLVFGLANRQGVDAIRMLWPAGIVQAETEFPSAGKTSFIALNITELDRKPSSCPYLYAWNGERFEFITDFMGAGEMGYLEEPGRYNKPNPVEYVRLRDDQLRVKNDRYELRVTNELEEALFVDRLQLLAIAHPPGTDVYPNEGMSDPPKLFHLFVTRDARPPQSAFDDHGHDVLDLISRVDRRWPDDFKKDRVRGYAAEHTLTLKLGQPQTAKNPQHVQLLLNGWTDYAWSSDNVAALQAGKTMKPPSLQVRDRKGNWRTVIDDIGIPVGRPQTVTVDLTGKFLSRSREVRIVTNMRIYWDQILVAASAASPVQIVRLDPMSADLRWRGFSAEVMKDGHEPIGYNYEKVSFTSPWKVMTGRYTREGDVRELLTSTDDRFVISRPGDEIALSFDGRPLPTLPHGWKRTFLLFADGFSKEMDINSASPDQLGPLPFHGMSRYPYRWPEHYPQDQKHRSYIDTYNTRIITTQVPGIDGETLHR